jgi:DNA polymerase III subunit gamma/tau
LAYQVLARKWRPQAFSELVGQEHVATTLLNALKSSRMPHALLFTGARGVGKTSAARILAKSLRCPNAKDFVPCHQCDDCREIAEGRSIDVIEIDGASNNGVENIRELRETVGYMPSRGKYKIYIIDEVHMLSTSAFNALLKTLEEPPPHVVFIFATTEVQKIPVTVLSRCQRFDFRRIPIRKVAERLKVIAEAEGVTAEPQALWLIARESEGSMRDSQSLLDQVITFSGKKVTHSQVVDILGLTDRTLLAATLKALIDRDASNCLEIIEKVFHLGYDPKQFAQDLLEHLRNLMIVKVSLAGQGKDQAEYLDLPDQEIDDLKQIAGSLGEEDVHLLFDMTLKGAGDVLRAQDPRIVLEMLLLRLSQAPRLTSIETLVAQLQSGSTLPAPKPGGSTPAGRGGLPTGGHGGMPRPSGGKPASDGAPARRTDAAVSASADCPPMTPELAEKWSGLVEQIKKEKVQLGAKLEYAALQSIEGNVVTICFKKEQEFLYTQMTQRDVVQQLNEIIGKYWGGNHQVEVRLVSGGATPPSPREKKDADKAEKDRAILAQAEAHPVIKDIKNVLKAKIVSIKEST